jgi:hypothetical protein
MSLVRLAALTGHKKREWQQRKCPIKRVTGAKYSALADILGIE